MKDKKNVQNKISVHAFQADCLGEHDAVGIASLMQKKEISVQEVIAATIARSNMVEPSINAIESKVFSHNTSHFDRSLQNHNGIFSGIPTFIKDNLDLKGAPTNYGSSAMSAEPAVEDGEFVRQYLKLGFIPMGKSSMPEFGFNASTEYMHRAPTRNPWNIEYSCGASSGGSAALVASGVVPIAHANDGGGSIRIPAACCGLIGLKPTRGRLISPQSMRKLPVDIVTQGVLTRSVRDTAHFYAEIEKVYQDPNLPPLGLIERPGERKVKVGMVIDSIVGNPTCYETRLTLIKTANLLEKMGHEVEEISFPIHKSFAKDFFSYWGMIAFFIAQFGHRTINPSFNAKKLDMLSKGLVASYKKQMLKTPMVIYRLQRVYQQLEVLFSRFDAILSPVVAHTTPKLGYLKPDQSFEELHQRLLNYANFTPLNNAAGNPGISIPMGTSSLGLPIGVQLSSAKGHERVLLELAYALEIACPWKKISSIYR